MCSGIAGLELGLHLALDDYRTVCAVEWDKYAQSILVARQADRTFEPFPIWDDVKTFDGHEWRGLTFSRPDTLANHFLSLAIDEELTTLAISGPTSLGSSENVSPPWFSWKTSQATFLSDSQMSAWSYVNWVIALRRNYRLNGVGDCEREIPCSLTSPLVAAHAFRTLTDRLLI